MNRRRMTFGDLIARLAPAPPPGAIAASPIVASAIELNGDGTHSGRQMWAVVHSVTDAELRLIHPQAFGVARIMVQIGSRTGEILRVVLETGACRQQGELFETCARFVPAGHGILSASA